LRKEVFDILKNALEYQDSKIQIAFLDAIYSLCEKSEALITEYNNHTISQFLTGKDIPSLLSVFQKHPDPKVYHRALNLAEKFFYSPQNLNSNQME